MDTFSIKLKYWSENKPIIVPNSDMRMRFFYIIIFFIYAFDALGQSQIIDDSTKQVYGPYTTFYQNFQDIKFNKYNLRKIDTVVGEYTSF